MKFECASDSCGFVSDLPAIAATDLTYVTLGFARVPEQAIRLESRSGHPHLARPVSALLTTVFAGRPWRTVAADQAVWVLGAGAADVRGWELATAPLDVDVTLAAPPSAGSWCCSTRCVAAIVAEILQEGGQHSYQHDARGLRALAEKAKGTAHATGAGATRRFDCCACPTSMTVPTADSARWLATHGCITAGGKFYCSRRCCMLGSASPSAPTTPTPTELQKADTTFTAGLARERAILRDRSMSLKSDATKKPGAR